MLNKKNYIDLHWIYSSLFTKENSVAVILKKPYLSGKSIDECLELKKSDYIDLDFTRFFGENKFHFARLRWDGLNYINGKIFLTNAWIENNTFNLPRDNRFIRIYLDDHDEANHYKNLFYKAELLKY